MWILHKDENKVKSQKWKNKDGKEYWILTHDLALVDYRPHQLPPIHALTYFAQHIVETGHARVFRLGIALENKLSAIPHFQSELKRVSAKIDPVCTESYLRDYDGVQIFICTLEAYLNAIYSSLEIVAKINRQLNLGLPIGFNKQRRKYALFSFDRWPWLPYFYDIRTELTHFGTTLPIISEEKVVINFTQGKELNVFDRGDHEVPFSNIFEFSTQLFNLLNTWAKQELTKVDPEYLLDCAQEQGDATPLKRVKIKAKEILDLMLEKDSS